jgi:hypothetical protein
MNLQPRDFLFAVTLAATPAAGQDAVPAVGPARNDIQSAASIPDFSGIWAHLTWPDLEPPPAGPGPVTNRSRRNGAGDIYQLVGDHTNPILTPKAAEVVKKKGEVELSGPSPTPSNQCWPGGVPFVFYNIGMQMPSWYGDAVGHYEGDTLVIDTVGVKIGPFAMIDMYGTPHSPALHVVERYRLLDYEAAKQAEERGQRGLTRFGRDPGFVPDPDYRGKGLQLELTVEDDGVFTTPWSAAISYRRPLGGWSEVACAENPDGYFPGKHVAVPTADKPDF